MSSQVGRIALSGLIGSLFVGVTAAAATANMASPTSPGDLVGDPAGDLAQLAIESEQLQIDLRPLERGEPALIDATYRIRNDAAARTVELVFVATSLADGRPTVSLDAQPLPFTTNRVPSGVSPPDDIGAAWPPPSTTPALAGSGRLSYSARVAGRLFFTPTIAPGQHEIIVRYPARATAYSGNSPARYWQLGYVLSPAREWASFGTLDVSVLLPRGWAAASDPALTREGDALSGTFRGIPADALAITTQMPVADGSALGPSLAIVSLLVGGIALAALGGRFLGRRRRSLWWFLPLGVVYALVATVAIVVIGVASPDVARAGIPTTQVAWTYGYGTGLVALLVAPLVLVAFIVGMQVLAAITAHLVRRRGAPT